MIKANELRIGNWVIDAWGTRRQVDGSTLRYLELEDEVVEPIPLTPEILEKAGFEKSEDEADVWLFPDDRGPWQLYNDLEHGLELWHEDDKYDLGSPKLTSIHQLQNLYFALTGEELDITF